MTMLIRVVLGVVALFFLVVGFRWMALPEAVAGEFSVSAVGIAGLSTLRGDLGGTFLAIGVLIALGLRRRAQPCLLAAALVIGCIALGRVVGFALDGWSEPGMMAFALETVLAALLVVGALRLRAGERHPL